MASHRRTTCSMVSSSFSHTRHCTSLASLWSWAAQVYRAPALASKSSSLLPRELYRCTIPILVTPVDGQRRLLRHTVLPLFFLHFFPCLVLPSLWASSCWEGCKRGQTCVSCGRGASLTKCARTLQTGSQKHAAPSALKACIGSSHGMQFGWPPPKLQSSPSSCRLWKCHLVAFNRSGVWSIESGWMLPCLHDSSEPLITRR